MSRRGALRPVLFVPMIYSRGAVEWKRASYAFFGITIFTPTYFVFVFKSVISVFKNGLLIYKCIINFSLMFKKRTFICLCTWVCVYDSRISRRGGDAGNRINLTVTRHRHPPTLSNMYRYRVESTSDITLVLERYMPLLISYKTSFYASKTKLLKVLNC